MTGVVDELLEFKQLERTEEAGIRFQNAVATRHSTLAKPFGDQSSPWRAIATG